VRKEKEMWFKVLMTAAIMSAIGLFVAQKLDLVEFIPQGNAEETMRREAIRVIAKDAKVETNWAKAEIHGQTGDDVAYLMKVHQQLGRVQLAKTYTPPPPDACHTQKLVQQEPKRWEVNGFCGKDWTFYVWYEGRKKNLRVDLYSPEGSKVSEDLPLPKFEAGWKSQAECDESTRVCTFEGFVKVTWPLERGGSLTLTEVLEKEGK